MLPSRHRDTISALLAATLSAVLYWYWLAAPVLKRLSIAEWRFIACGAAVVIGVALGRMGINFAVLASSSAVGLVLGGVWAALFAPNDVTVPFSTELSDAFIYSLTLWREMSLLTVAVVLGGLLSRAANRPSA